VTFSICEVEYVRQTQIVKEIILLRNLLIQLPNDQDYSQKVIIYENNQNAIILIKNSQFHVKTKHIDIQTHFVREKMIENAIELEYVFTNQMIIDDLFKSLFRNKFVTFRVILEVRWLD
jgi:hypothetical protein